MMMVRTSVVSLSPLRRGISEATRKGKSAEQTPRIEKGGTKVSPFDFGRFERIYFAANNLLLHKVVDERPFVHDGRSDSSYIEIC